MKYIYTILITSFFLNTNAEQTFEEQIRRLEQMDKYAEEAFEKEFKYSLEGIKGLGVVISESSKNYIGPHDDSPMMFKEFIFEGLKVEAHFKTDDLNRAHVTRILITSSDWPIKHGLNVGVKKQQIFERLGEVEILDGEQLSYCGEADCVVFTLKKDYVKTIEITYYFD